MAVCAPLVLRSACGVDEPAGIPPAARPLDADAREAPRVPFRCPELRVRAGGAQDDGRRYGGASSRRYRRDSQRRRARARSDSQALQRPVRSLAAGPIGDSAFLRARRSDGVCRLLESRDDSFGRCDSTTRNSRAGMPGGATRRWAAPNWSVTEQCDPPRCGSSTRNPVSRTQPDKSARSGCTVRTWRTGYWKKPEESSTRFRRTTGQSVRGNAGGPLAADRRPWRHLRRRTVHHRPDQGPADRGRFQPLSRRHRGDDPGDQQGAGRRHLDHRRIRRKSLLPSSKSRSSAESDEEHSERLRALKRELTSAVSNIHRLRVADLVFVPPGSMPITTSGKVRQVDLRRAVPAEMNSSVWKPQHD